VKLHFLTAICLPVPDFDARFIAGFLFRFVCAALFIYPCMVLLFNTTPMAIRFDEWPTRVLLAFSCALFAAIVTRRPRAAPWFPARRIVASWIVVFVAVLPFALLKLVMGDNQIGSILIFLRGDNLGEVVSVGRGSYGPLLLRAAALFGAFAAMLVFLVRRYAGMEWIVHVLCVVLVALHPLTGYFVGLAVPNRLHAEFDAGESLLRPGDLEAPAQAKNLIIVYLESLEATFANLPETADGFTPLRRLRERSFSASNVHQVEGTQHTIAGIVASQCGVPLIPYGLNDIGFDHHTKKSLTSFMPSIVCLGDVLSEHGYTVSYMNGASLERYSKRGFLTSHGYARLFGLESVDPATLSGRDNVFGMGDGLLFEHVANELDVLRRAGKPFLLSVLTVGTHGPGGFLDRDCPREEPAGNTLATAIRCTGRALEQLLDLVDRSGLGETTLVAVMSDHLVANQQLIQAPSLSRALAGARRNRRNLFFIHGLERRVVTRDAAAIDIYPTLLEALGYRLADRRANLGVSLLSEEPTLVEIYGARGVNGLFRHNQRLARVLWRD